MNAAKADKVTGRFNGQFQTEAICRTIHNMGESNDPVLWLTKSQGNCLKEFMTRGNRGLFIINKQTYSHLPSHYDFDPDHTDPLQEPQFLRFCPDITTYQVHHSGQISEHHSVMVFSSWKARIIIILKLNIWLLRSRSNLLFLNIYSQVRWSLQPLGSHLCFSLRFLLWLSSLLIVHMSSGRIFISGDQGKSFVFTLLC